MLSSFRIRQSRSQEQSQNWDGVCPGNSGDLSHCSGGFKRSSCSMPLACGSLGHLSRDMAEDQKEGPGGTSFPCLGTLANAHMSRSRGDLEGALETPIRSEGWQCGMVWAGSCYLDPEPIPRMG